MGCNKKQFYESSIARLELLIPAYEDAIKAVVEGGVQSYELDTGQNKTRVTKLNVSNYQLELDKMYNRYEDLCKKLEAINSGNSSGMAQVYTVW